MSNGMRSPCCCRVQPWLGKITSMFVYRLDVTPPIILYFGLRGWHSLKSAYADAFHSIRTCNTNHNKPISNTKRMSHSTLHLQYGTQHDTHHSYASHKSSTLNRAHAYADGRTRQRAKTAQWPIIFDPSTLELEHTSFAWPCKKQIIKTDWPVQWLLPGLVWGLAAGIYSSDKCYSSSKPLFLDCRDHPTEKSISGEKALWRVELNQTSRV